MSGALVSAAELAQELGAGGLAVLDATVELPPAERDGGSPAQSGRDRFLEAHIPGARHADLLAELADQTRPFRFAQPAAGDLAGRLAALGVGASTRVVAYDDDGMMWSTRLWLALRAIGHDDVAVLDGGLGAWRRRGGPIQLGRAAACAVATEPIAPAPRPGVFVDRADVLAVVSGERPGRLVCTLGPEVFAGRAPTRYARRGHIPGSFNAPARALLDASGRLRPRAELEYLLGSYLNDSEPLVLYCGGGISASLVAFVLHLLGRDDVAVYDGSLEEWAADPALPLEVLA